MAKENGKKLQKPTGWKPSTVYTLVTILIAFFAAFSKVARFPELGIDSAFSTFVYRAAYKHTCSTMFKEDGTPDMECINNLRVLQTKFLGIMTGNSMTNVKTFNVPVTDEWSVPIEVYRPMPNKVDDVIPVIIYMHGGGYTIGSMKGDEPIARTLADMSKFLVVNVDYRLAPEHPYPAALNDVMAVYKWIVEGEGATLIGADKSKISLVGESAGGNLAAVTALDIAEKELGEICLTGLVSAKLDKGCQYPSCQQYGGDGYMVSMKEADEFLDLYTAKQTLSESDEYKVYPLLAPTELLQKLGPHHTITAEADILRDEDEAYAEKLSRYGVNSTLKRYTRTTHGFFGKTFTHGTKAVYDLALVAREKCL